MPPQLEALRPSKYDLSACSHCQAVYFPGYDPSPMPNAATPQITILQPAATTGYDATTPVTSFALRPHLTSASGTATPQRTILQHAALAGVVALSQYTTLQLPPLPEALQPLTYDPSACSLSQRCSEPSEYDPSSWNHSLLCCNPPGYDPSHSTTAGGTMSPQIQPFDTPAAGALRPLNLRAQHAPTSESLRHLILLPLRLYPLSGLALPPNMIL